MADEPLHFTMWGCPGKLAGDCDTLYGGYPPDACPEQTIVPEDRQSSEEHAVQCCSSSSGGTTCERPAVVSTWADAVSACARLDKRLCTKAEIETEVCCNKGNSFDFQRVWACSVTELETDPTSCAGCSEGEIWDPDSQACASSCSEQQLWDVNAKACTSRCPQEGMAWDATSQACVVGYLTYDG
eukprot:238380-Rhodomonas_salina.2